MLWQGAILAYPTEAVYGLGCNPFNESAVFRLLSLKQRPVEKGLILIADSFERLEPLVGEIPQKTLDRVLADWPGPVTWLMPAAKGVPHWLTGDHTSLAMRVTDHPIASALCRASGLPLVSTSANLSQKAPARTPLQVRLCCGGGVDWIVHGETGGNSRPTPIKDALSGKILRH
jgi:L-threonylcarbamoyladenylate synthase